MFVRGVLFSQKMVAKYQKIVVKWQNFYIYPHTSFQENKMRIIWRRGPSNTWSDSTIDSWIIYDICRYFKFKNGKKSRDTVYDVCAKLDLKMGH